jgi:flagellar protein FlbT
MSGLVLRLRPHEKVLVNGVMLENGDRRARLHVRTTDANILRFRDAIHPQDANTPAKRLYYLAQLVVAGDADSAAIKNELVPGIEALRAAFGEKLCREALEAALAAAREGKFYNVMRQLARILPHEAALLVDASAGKCAPQGV